MKKRIADASYAAQMQKTDATEKETVAETVSRVILCINLCISHSCIKTVKVTVITLYGYKMAHGVF